MALTFDPLAAANRRRNSGATEPLAEATVEVVQDATGALVTPEYLSLELARMEARFNRALLVLAGFIVAVAGASLAGSQLPG